MIEEINMRSLELRRNYTEPDFIIMSYSTALELIGEMNLNPVHEYIELKKFITPEDLHGSRLLGMEICVASIEDRYFELYERLK